MQFKILKKSQKSAARLGLIKTPHGEVKTPAYVSVATQATIKTLHSEEVEAVGSQILIANTYHLHIRPTEQVIQKHGGIHKFMNWKKPMMTDSGGFQVFSLGFGKDFGTGKILKGKKDASIREGQQPKLIKITEDGVHFKSYYDGKDIFLGPKESIKIQEKIGADIIFAFDECTSPIADYDYTKKSLEKTHRWAKICIKSKKTKQALYGIVQGGKFKDLRIESAQLIGSLGFDGFGIGGEFGDDKSLMFKTLNTIFQYLPQNKPRHLLGVGHLDDLVKTIKAGVDTFDCITPTHYARHGYAFTSKGKINLNKKDVILDKKPLDPNCSCFVCKNYSRGYIAHLLKAWEITPLKLLTFHNLYFFNKYVEKISEEIKKGNI